MSMTEKYQQWVIDCEDYQEDLEEYFEALDIYMQQTDVPRLVNQQLNKWKEDAHRDYLTQRRNIGEDANV